MSCTTNRRMRDLAATAGLVLSLCVGCVDPGGEFNDFVKRLGPPKDAGAVTSGDGAACSVAPGSVQGDYLFVLSVSASPSTPIVLKTSLTTPADDGGTGLSFNAQPLAASDRTTPVGDPLTLGPFPVDPNGNFTASLSGLHVAGAANPITSGDITADLTLSGNLCGDGSFFCGTASGDATAPIMLSLSGSTFTLTKLTSSGIPTQPKINCAGTLAAPPKGM